MKANVNVSVFSGSVQKERVYALMPTGEYALTLNDLTFETGGSYGDSLLWKWLIADPATPTDYLCRDDGNEKVHHEYSSPDIVLGSKSHEWIAALTGQVLADGDDPPDSDDLIGKRMLVYITHQAPKQGPNVGKLRERFVQGSAKALRGVAAQKVMAGKRLALVEKATRLIGRAVKLETPNHEAYQALDLMQADEDQLEQLVATVSAEVQTALDE